jgi:hypothetical protein
VCLLRRSRVWRAMKAIAFLAESAVGLRIPATTFQTQTQTVGGIRHRASVASWSV